MQKRQAELVRELRRQARRLRFAAATGRLSSRKKSETLGMQLELLHASCARLRNADILAADQALAAAQLHAIKRSLEQSTAFKEFPEVRRRALRHLESTIRALTPTG